MGLIYQTLLSFLPTPLLVLFFGFMAFLTVLTIFRIVKLVLDALPFL